MSDVEPRAPRNEANVRRKVEWFLGVAIALLLAVASVPGVRSTAHRSGPTNTTVRGLEGLLSLARDEAIQTGEDHIVLFERGSGRELGGSDSGLPLMALLIRDRDGDGRPSESEVVASVRGDGEGRVQWGSALATKPADGDAASELSGPMSFGESGSQIRERGLVFRADGTPHTHSSASGGSGDSGAGAVYLHGPVRDYAVVLSPWGDVDVQVWDTHSQSWQLAPAP